jgi:outer membrane lipoprotein carrier protein
VVATPKARDGQLQTIRVGFKAGEGASGRAAVLYALEILDSFGQRSLLTFAQFEMNPVLNAAAFQFKPPPGADVIRP